MIYGNIFGINSMKSNIQLYRDSGYTDDQIVREVLAWKCRKLNEKPWTAADVRAVLAQGGDR